MTGPIRDIGQKVEQSSFETESSSSPSYCHIFLRNIIIIIIIIKPCTLIDVTIPAQRNVVQKEAESS